MVRLSGRPALRLFGSAGRARPRPDRLNFAALVAAPRGHAAPRRRRHSAVGDRFRLERGRRRRPAEPCRPSSRPATRRRRSPCAPRRSPGSGRSCGPGNFAPTDATLAGACRRVRIAPTLLGPAASPQIIPQSGTPAGVRPATARIPRRTATRSSSLSTGPASPSRCRAGRTGRYLTATVDGGPANRLPRDESGAAYLVLHDPAAASRVIPLATGLPSGLHNVRLGSTGGWGQWPLRAVVVVAETPPPSGLGWLLLALALAGTLAWAAAFLIARRRAGREEAAPPPSSSAPAATPAWGRPTIPAALLFGLAALLAVAYHLSGSGLLNFAMLGLFGLLFLLDPGIAPAVDRRQPPLLAAHAAGPALGVCPVRGARLDRRPRLGRPGNARLDDQRRIPGERVPPLARQRSAGQSARRDHRQQGNRKLARHNDDCAGWLGPAGRPLRL